MFVIVSLFLWTKRKNCIHSTSYSTQLSMIMLKKMVDLSTSYKASKGALNYETNFLDEFAWFKNIIRRRASPQRNTLNIWYE